MLDEVEEKELDTTFLISEASGSPEKKDVDVSVRRADVFVEPEPVKAEPVPARPAPAQQAPSASSNGLAQSQSPSPNTKSKNQRRRERERAQRERGGSTDNSLSPVKEKLA